MAPQLTEQQAVRPLRWGVIAAAGRGTRAYPYTENTHKALLPVDGTPNIEHLIGLMQTQMGITDICIVIGHLGDSIRAHLGDGARFGIRLHYLVNSELERGLAWSVLLAAERVHEPFCLMLCDECYIDSNHRELAAQPLGEDLFICTGLPVDDLDLIRSNFAVEHDGEQVKALTEKPATPINNLLGCGSFLCSPKLFAVLRAAFAQTPAYVEFVDCLNRALAQGETARLFVLEGSYVNINDRDSLAKARFHRRDRYFEQAKKALLIYCEAGVTGLAFTLARYRELNVFDRIYIVFDQCQQQVVAAVANGCTLCPVADGAPYGEKIRAGIAAISEDIVVLTEVDYSFASRDVFKLFSYLCDADLVVGTRTTRQLIAQGSSMRGVVRLAHTLLGMLIGLLWWDREVRLTDTGCTLRAFWRSSYQEVLPSLAVAGPEFSPAMVIAYLQRRLRVIEVPVHYFNRSASQIHAYQRPRNAWRFARLIVARRLGLRG